MFPSILWKNFSKKTQSSLKIIENSSQRRNKKEGNNKKIGATDLHGDKRKIFNFFILILLRA
jgi:hypothetical protein